MLTASTIDPKPARRRRRTSRIELGERGFTVPTRASREVLAELDATIAALDVEHGGDQAVGLEVKRPRTRGECVAGDRPCPFVGCRHHMALNVTETGSLQIVDHLDLESLPETCSLDVADRGEHTLEAVGQLLNITRERVRQVERIGLVKARALVRLGGIREDALPFVPDHNHSEP